MKYKYRDEVAEEMSRQNGSNADIQRRVMQEFSDSWPNPTRAQWYRRSWEKGPPGNVPRHVTVALHDAH